jgi:hypothetical protein
VKAIRSLINFPTKKNNDINRLYFDTPPKKDSVGKAMKKKAIAPLKYLSIYFGSFYLKNLMSSFF